MAEIAGIRQFLGKSVHLALAGGPTLDGHLLSCDGRSLWLVTDGEDRFVPLADVDVVTAPFGAVG